MTEWKMMGEHTYAVGVEPCNVGMAPRNVLREKGLLPMLEPGEARDYHVRIGVISTAAELDALKKAVG